MANEIETIEREIEDTFNDFLGTKTTAGDYRSQWAPDTDVTEDKDGFTLQVALPGVKREAVETELKENTLIITGKREGNEFGRRNMIRREIPYGRFYRAFNLDTPVKPGDVKATLKDGILEIYLPKTEESKLFKIKVE